MHISNERHTSNDKMSIQYIVEETFNIFKISAQFSVPPLHFRLQRDGEKKFIRSANVIVHMIYAIL